MPKNKSGIGRSNRFSELELYKTGYYYQFQKLLWSTWVNNKVLKSEPFPLEEKHKNFKQ